MASSRAATDAFLLLLGRYPEPFAPNLYVREMLIDVICQTGAEDETLAAAPTAVQINSRYPAYDSRSPTPRNGRDRGRR
jgi:hypothetical protein